MNLDISFIVQTTIILGFVWAVFSYVILRPIQAMLEDNRALINEVRANVSALQQMLQQTNERTIICDRDVKSAHKRIDTIERYIKPTHLDHP